MATQAQNIEQYENLLKQEYVLENIDFLVPLMTNWGYFQSTLDRSIEFLESRKIYDTKTAQTNNIIQG